MNRQLPAILAIGTLGALMLGFALTPSRPPPEEYSRRFFRAVEAEAGCILQRDYQFALLRPRRPAVLVDPQGQRHPARTVVLYNVMRRLKQDYGERITPYMNALRRSYVEDLDLWDELAIVPPGWRLADAVGR